MGLDDRVWYLLLGCLIGFVLGYITRALRDIKEELEEVEHVITERRKDERGFMRYPIAADVAMILVLMLTVYAAFASQQASNDVKDAQDRIARITSCNRVYLTRALDALNERSTYSTEQAKNNVALQREQLKLLEVLLTQPPPTPEQGREALVNYYDAGVKSYISVNGKALAKFRANPYPTEAELEACLSGED